MLFADGATYEVLITAVVAALGGGGAGAGVAKVLRGAGEKLGTAVPGIAAQFGTFVTSQIDAAKADREADRAERAATAKMFAEQMAKRDELFTRELARRDEASAKRDEMFARELARLSDAVDRATEANAEANARTAAVVEALSKTVAVLAARVGVEHAELPAAVAPAPRERDPGKSGAHKKPGTTGG